MYAGGIMMFVGKKINAQLSRIGQNMTNISKVLSDSAHKASKEINSLLEGIKDHFSTTKNNNATESNVNPQSFGQTHELTPNAMGELVEMSVQQLDPEDEAKNLLMMNDKEAADFLSDMRDSKAANILTLPEMDEVKAGDFLSVMIGEKAASILSVMDEVKAGDFLSGMRDSEAANILSGMRDSKAANILSEMDNSKAANILSKMDDSKAANILSKTEIGRKDKGYDKSNRYAANILSKMSNEKASNILSQISYIKKINIVNYLKPKTPKSKHFSGKEMSGPNYSQVTTKLNTGPKNKLSP